VPLCREVIRAAERGEIQIVTSAVALTEVIKLNKGPIEIPKQAEEQIKGFFKQEYIIVVQVTRSIAESARSLIWTFPGLRPKDALHAATALYAGIEFLHTFDDDFLPLDEKIGTPLLKIREPHMPQRDLPLEPPPTESSVEPTEENEIN
jgi:predicted nucleic acid-binding protein